jgi:hypothetical protein
VVPAEQPTVEWRWRTHFFFLPSHVPRGSCRRLLDRIWFFFCCPLFSAHCDYAETQPRNGSLFTLVTSSGIIYATQRTLHMFLSFISHPANNLASLFERHGIYAWCIYMRNELQVILSWLICSVIRSGPFQESELMTPSVCQKQFLSPCTAIACIQIQCTSVRDSATSFWHGIGLPKLLSKCVDNIP